MITFFTTIWQWILAIPEKIMAAFAYLMDKLTILFYDLMTWSVSFAADTFTSFMSSSTYLSGMEANYLGLSLDTRYAIEALNIPQAILILIGAYVLRFAIKLIPFV